MWSLLFDLYTALLVPRYRYADYNQTRARVTLFISFFLAAGCLILLFSLVLISASSSYVNVGLSLGLVVLLTQVVVMSLVHSGQLRPAMILLFFTLSIAALVVVLLSSIRSSMAILLVFPLLYAALIMPWSGVLVALISGMALVAGIAILQAQGTVGSNVVPPPPTPDQLSAHLVVILAILGVIGTFTATFAYELHRTMRYARRLVTQLRATAEIAQIAVVVSGPAEFTQRAVNYIRDRFGFYHVQIFLVDAERRYANLVASTGEAGELLMQRGYRMAVGSPNAIGIAMQSGEPMTVTNQEETLPRRANELLRDTRSELVLPLIVTDQVIGALDIQSARPNAFIPELIESLRVLAAQVSVALYNTRQLEEARMALSDTRRLFLESEVNLREAQRLNQRLTGQAWQEYLMSRSSQTVGYTLADNRLQHDTTWTPGLEQAAGSRHAVIVPSPQERQVFAVPIELRGRTIGAIEVEVDSSVRQAEALEVLQSVAQRLALSIDNARLFEQAQELAQRELEVNTISTNLQSISDINDLARATIQELSRALGASQASIRLGAVNVDAHGNNGLNRQG